LARRKEEGDQGALRKLIESQIHIIYPIACELCLKYGEPDWKADLVSIGHKALCEAADSFDYRRATFSTFAKMVVRRGMERWIRGEISHKRRFLRATYAEEGEDKIGDLLENLFPDYSSLKVSLCRLITIELDEEESTVIEGKALGKTYKELGQETGLSERTLRRRFCSARRKMRRMLKFLIDNNLL